MTSFNMSADPCLPLPCHHGGRCLRYGSYYICDCTNNFYGQSCELANFCASSPCRNGGTCQSWSTNYMCSCPTGYGGLNCDDFNICATSPCVNGGICQRLYPNSYWCYCPTGYVGVRCETRNVCESSPCQNGGTCQLLYPGYMCSCPTGYQGVNCNIHANSYDIEQDFMTPRPTEKSAMNTSNVSFTVWMFPVIALVALVIITVCSVVIVKKRNKRQRQRQQQFGFGLPDTIVRSISGNLPSDTRVNTGRVSPHPTSPHPYNVRFARRHRHTNTCVIEHISLSAHVSNHVSPQQPHLHDNGESRLGGGSVNDGYDHVTDLPPTYLSVVTNPGYVRDQGDCLQLPPSYDDVVGTIRPAPAPMTNT